jgi:RNA polymerase sigma-70 factor (sigma-E family)
MANTILRVIGMSRYIASASRDEVGSAGAQRGAQRAKSGRVVQRCGGQDGLLIMDSHAGVVASPSSWPQQGRAEAAEAVAALFQQHHLDLVRMAAVMLGDVGAAEDVVQDAFEKLQVRWHRLRDPGSALAYARATVLNGCRTALRRSILARKHAAQAGVTAQTGPDAAQAIAEGSELMGALRGLPRRQREVLVLRFYVDLDVAEAAAVLKINPSTVRATTTRALARLAQTIKEG